MPKKIVFNTEEVRTIFMMKSKGYTVKEIAEKVGHSTKTVQNFIDRYRLSEDGSTKKRQPGEPAQFVRQARKKITVVSREVPNIETALDELPEHAPGFVKEEKPESEWEKMWDDASKMSVKQATEVAKDLNKDSNKTTITMPNKSLDSFSPRELIKKLYDLGYRIENNELVCYVRTKVQLKEILANG